jgi:hypothetical protein
LRSAFSLALACLTILGLASATSVCVGSAAMQDGAGGSASAMNRGRVVKWYVIRPPKNDYVRIGTTAQWCPGNGEPRPVIDSVLERDTPRAVILTARLAYQAGKLCASVNLPVEHVVLLKRRLSSRPLYDGSQRPPVRRWPRRGRSAAGSELNEGVPRWPTAPLLSTPF